MGFQQYVRWSSILGLLFAILMPFHAPAGAAPPAAALSKIRIAFTQNDNVYLMNADGSRRIAVTTRGSASSNVNPKVISYPWYQWSPDGKYLLLVRERHQFDPLALKNGIKWVVPAAWDLLLINTKGDLIRTLISGAPVANVFPAWAQDADLIAYVSAMADSHQMMPLNVRFTVSRLDVQGQHAPLWTYEARATATKVVGLARHRSLIR